MTPTKDLVGESVIVSDLIEAMRRWLAVNDTFNLPWALAETLAELIAAGPRLSDAAVAAERGGPADDAEAASADWLHAVGFRPDPRGEFGEDSLIARGDVGDVICRGSHRPGWVYECHDETWIDLPDQPTRGDVRGLCHALGVKLAAEGGAP